MVPRLGGKGALGLHSQRKKESASGSVSCEHLRSWSSAQTLDLGQNLNFEGVNAKLVE